MASYVAREMKGSKGACSRYSGKRIVITGGTGSFGHFVARKLLETDVEQIRIFSRDEAKQDATRHEVPAAVTLRDFIERPESLDTGGIVTSGLRDTSRGVVNFIRSTAQRHRQRAGLRLTDPRF